MNEVNINHFQFEYDLTWMSFFQNHLGQTYLRYGGREDIGAESHLNKDSLLLAMRETLRLHSQKTPREFSRFEPSNETVSTPIEIPSMVKILAKRQNKCVHCHEVKSANLKELQSTGKLEKRMVFTYPSPLNLGIQLDAVEQNKIQSIVKSSAAETTGLKANDIIQSLDGHPVFTFADVTRVLELAPDEGVLKVEAKREGVTIESEIRLADSWKTNGDPSWRESTHIVGPNSGFWAVELTASQRKSMKIDEDKLALRANAIWGDWAKKAGIKHGDVVTSIDGKSNKMSIKQLQTYLQMNKEWGEVVKLVVIRKRKPKRLTMTLPQENHD